MKWKVAHVIATNFYGGPEKQIIEHLKRLDASVYSGFLISFLEDNRDNEILMQAQREGIEHQGISMNSPFDIGAWMQLRKEVRTNAVNLLCVHGYKATVMGSWIHKTLRIPTLAFSRGYTAENLKVAFYEYIDRLALRHVSGIVCVSAGQREKLETLGVRTKNMWVVHNAVVTPEVVPDSRPIRATILKRLALPEGSMICLSAGRLSPEKGHEDLIRAIAALRERSDGWHFVFCGDGPCQAQLEKLAQTLQIQNRVHFAGFRKDLPEIFQAMDLFVLPSHSEGLPNVVLEAFSYGKAVVATSVGGVPELVEDGLSGIVVQPRQPALLAEAMARCMADGGLRQTLGDAGRCTVRSRFTFEEQNRILQSIYAQVLLHNPPVQ